jgi:hypothetical protein
MFVNGSTNKNAPIGTEPALLPKFPLSPEGVEPDVIVGTIVTALVADGFADGERTYDELVTMQALGQMLVLILDRRCQHWVLMEQEVMG